MREVLYTLHNLTNKNDVDDSDMWKVLAYQVVTDNMKQSFLRTAYSNLINPAAFTPGEMKSLGVDFIKVSEDIYTKYINIINGNSATSLRALERLI